jgi:hypothetical protein
MFLCKNALDNDLNKIEICRAENEVFMTSGGDGG